MRMRGIEHLFLMADSFYYNPEYAIELTLVDLANSRDISIVLASSHERKAHQPKSCHFERKISSVQMGSQK